MTKRRPGRERRNSDTAHAWRKGCSPGPRHRCGNSTRAGQPRWRGCSGPALRNPAPLLRPRTRTAKKGCERAALAGAGGRFGEGQGGTSGPLSGHCGGHRAGRTSWPPAGRNRPASLQNIPSSRTGKKKTGTHGDAKHAPRMFRFLLRLKIQETTKERKRKRQAQKGLTFSAGLFGTIQPPVSTMFPATLTGWNKQNAPDSPKTAPPGRKNALKNK